MLCNMAVYSDCVAEPDKPEIEKCENIDCTEYLESSQARPHFFKADESVVLHSNRV